MFKPKTHVLNWPVNDDKGQEINTVESNVLTMGQHRKITKTHKGKEVEILRACISASTGLTAGEIKRLITPDHTSIKNNVLELMHAKAQLLIDENYELEREELNQQLQSLLDEDAAQSDIDSIQQRIDAAVFNHDEPVLLIPFQGDDGQDKTSYKLRPPSVGTTDLMEKHKDEWERTLFISTSCSGFSPAELERMSLPDWNQLQERLIDFLERSADFFRL